MNHYFVLAYRVNCSRWRVYRVNEQIEALKDRVPTLQAKKNVSHWAILEVTGEERVVVEAGGVHLLTETEFLIDGTFFGRG